MAEQGRKRWVRAAVITALAALVLAWPVVQAVKVVTWFAVSDSPDSAPCADALAFGGAKLPKGAYDAHCTVETWQGSTYDATFRMPGDGVRGWLRTTYPDAPKPYTGTGDCGKGTDLCLDLNGAGDHGPPPGAKADAVSVEVRYEGHGRALVRFSAFTV